MHWTASTSMPWIFLHKPFAYERFEKAVEKAIVFIEARQNKLPENIIIKQEYNNISIPISDILYIEAMENYTKIFRINGNYILSRTSLKSIQEMLPEKGFSTYTPLVYHSG